MDSCFPHLTKALCCIRKQNEKSAPQCVFHTRDTVSVMSMRLHNAHRANLDCSHGTRMHIICIYWICDVQLGLLQERQHLPVGNSIVRQNLHGSPNLSSTSQRRPEVFFFQIAELPVPWSILISIFRRSSSGVRFDQVPPLFRKNACSPSRLHPAFDTVMSTGPSTVIKMIRYISAIIRTANSKNRNS
jgi:hypothetical protein